ncbi:MAG: ABC transporter permease, partial [Flavobacteriaceae bacterium]|nr:ABC transporter permease [Flavobacteriaceae bacterium]
MVIIQNIGSYFLMLSKVFTRFSRWSVMKDLIIREVDSLIIQSVGIVSFISFFV